jgi:NAD(P)-dependent dehydrogenase (short-subunit alcohol dehydrogenase family)
VTNNTSPPSYESEQIIGEDMDLDKRTILIIGGTSVSASVLRRWRHVLAHSSSLPAGTEESWTMTLRGTKAEVVGHVVDAADEKGLKAFLENVGPFDHLVSMAGGFMGGGFLEAPVDVIQVFTAPAAARITHRAPLLATTLSGPSFRASPSNLRHAVAPMRLFQWRIRL